MIVLSGADLVLPDRILSAGTLVIDAGRIAEIRGGSGPGNQPPASPFAFHGHSIVPGFIDVHVHGVEGFDTLGAGDPIAEIARRLPRYGAAAPRARAGAPLPRVAGRRIRARAAGPPREQLHQRRLPRRTTSGLPSVAAARTRRTSSWRTLVTEPSALSPQPCPRSLLYGE